MLHKDLAEFREKLSPLTPNHLRILSFLVRHSLNLSARYRPRNWQKYQLAEAAGQLAHLHDLPPWPIPYESDYRSATWGAAENDCLERRNSIRPRVPSHVAYKAERGGNELFWSPWTMYPRSQERHRNREATVYLPA